MSLALVLAPPGIGTALAKLTLTDGAGRASDDAADTALANPQLESIASEIRRRVCCRSSRRWLSQVQTKSCWRQGNGRALLVATSGC
jgi:hypothetical protein